MTRTGDRTRERILDGAERLILDQGLAATSVDAILAETNTSKGAFFHHFPSKNHLARALVERYAATDIAWLDEAMTKAETESEDPVVQLATFLRLFEDASDDFASKHPSCLFVSYIYDRRLFEDGTNDVIAATFLAWRQRLADKLRAAAEIHPPAIPFDPDAVADHVFVTFEGAFVLARTLNDRKQMRSQLELVRAFLNLLFNSNIG